MKLIAVIFFLAIILVVVKIADGANESQCKVGQASAFVSMNPEPFLIGQLPSAYTNNPRYFLAKYNCKRKDIFARRVDQGQYEVRFPDVNTRAVIATAISDEGVAASTYPVGQSTQRIVLRGPGGLLRDVAFSVVVY